jgi:hypothetical protein
MQTKDLSLKKLEKRVKTGTGIEDKIHPVGEIERNLALLCYGDQKTGKTVFGCTFPKPLLLIDIVEDGDDSVVDVDGVDVLHLREWQELEDAYWYLERGTQYKSVVLDQLTGLQSLVIRDLKAKKGQKPDDVFSQRSYGQLGGLLIEWMKNYKNLIKPTEDREGYHVCFLAHQKRIDPQEEDDDRLAPEVTAALTGSIVSYVLGAVSVIGNQYIRRVKVGKHDYTFEHCMRLVSDYYRCGIRRPVSAGAAPEYIVDPTFEKIMALSKGETLARRVKKL